MVTDLPPKLALPVMVKVLVELIVKVPFPLIVKEPATVTLVSSCGLPVSIRMLSVLDGTPQVQLLESLHKELAVTNHLFCTTIEILFDVAGELAKQGVALDVISTVTTSLLANVVVVKVALSVPTLLPLTFHWYDGEVPPLVGVAVNVTLVPIQIAPVGDAAVATLAVRVGFTVTVVVFELEKVQTPL
jgi:hypothetical protein